MAEKRKSKTKPNVEVVRVGSNNYVLFRPSDVYPALRDKKALHIGNLDNNKVFHPTEAYFSLTKDYLEAIVFPSDWSLKNIPASNLSVSIKEPVAQGATGPKSNTTKKKEVEELAPELKTIESQINSNFDNQISFGATWLLYQSALKLGIVEDLMKVFAGDKEKVNRIFTLASYALMTYDDYDSMEQWQEDNFLMTRAYLDYPSVVRYLSGVTEKDCEEFMRLRMERLPKEHMVCLCVQTPRSVIKGLDSDNFGVSAPEEVELSEDVVFYGFDSKPGRFLNHYSFNEKIPFYYAELPSNWSDKKSIAPQILKVIDKVGVKDLDNFCLVSDCGENNISDLDPLIQKGIKFQSKAYPRQEDLKRIIRENFPNPEDPSAQAPSLFDSRTDQYSYQQSTLHKIKVDPSDEQVEVEIKTTVTLNTSAQEDWINQISNELAEQTEKAQKALDQKIHIPNLKALEEDCFLLKFKYDKKTGTVTDFFHNDTRIEEEILIAGYEGFRTFGFDISSEEVSYLDTEYCMQEYALSNIKGGFGRNRFVGNEKETRQGKRLVVFIALILNAFLERKMEENDLFRLGVEPKDLLTEVNKVYATRRNGKIYFAGKNISRYQQCLKALGAELPKGIRL